MKCEKKQGCIAKAVREMYTNFKDIKSSYPNFMNAMKNAKRWYEDMKAGQLESTGDQKKRF